MEKYLASKGLTGVDDDDSDDGFTTTATSPSPKSNISPTSAGMRSAVTPVSPIVLQHILDVHQCRI